MCQDGGFISKKKELETDFSLFLKKVRLVYGKLFQTSLMLVGLNCAYLGEKSGAVVIH